MTRIGKNTDLRDHFCELQSIFLEANPACFERFAGRALGSLLGVLVRIVRAGDQRGDDGGVPGIGNADATESPA